MKTTDDPPGFDLKAVNQRHIEAADKFFRMYAGAASNLVSYEGGIIGIEVRVDQRLPLPVEEMVQKLAASWHREPELGDATGYVAHVYRSLRPSGFSVPAGNRGWDELLEVLVRHFKEMAREYPDILIGTWEGQFEGDTP